MDLSKKINVAPQACAKSMKLSAEGQAEMKKLAALNDKAFDKAYINAMVKDHKAALQLLQNSIKTSTNADLIAHLEATKNHVITHLQQAQEIQKTM